MPLNKETKPNSIFYSSIKEKTKWFRGRLDSRRFFPIINLRRGQEK